MNDDLARALDQLVPEPSEQGDWEAVIGLAGERRVHPRRLIVATLAAAAVVILTAPALAYFLGWIGRQDVPYSQSKPAPNVVKKQFADLAIGAPPRMRPGVKAAQAREVGRFRVRGKLRALWVVPTSKGGFCFTWENLFGGCLPPPAKRRPLVASWGGSLGPGERARTILVEGEVTGANAARLELVYEDGAHTQIPFVYVSKPIDAGFFDLAIPVRRQTGRGRAKEVVLYDDHGAVITREAVPKPRRPMRLPVPTQPPAPPRPVPTAVAAPTAPLQRASAYGVSVVAGANGSVVFRTAGLDAARRALMRTGTSYGCFKLTREFGIFDALGLGIGGRLQPVAAVRVTGIKPPLDGCELSSEAGHRWPDRFRSHGPVELAFTPAGHRYFADRAAARDLALFVRSRRVQQLRKEPPGKALRDLRTVYPQLAGSSIRIVPTPGGLTFSETSSTGKRFEVVVLRGKIVRQNLKPYAFVF